LLRGHALRRPERHGQSNAEECESRRARSVTNIDHGGNAGQCAYVGTEYVTPLKLVQRDSE